MYLNEIIDAIKCVCLRQPHINQFIFQDREVLNNSAELEYGIILLFLNSSTVNLNTTNYNFSLYFIDRLESRGNMLDIFNYGSWLIPNILRALSQVFDTDISNNRLEYFKENFADICSVVGTSFEVEVENETGCVELPCI